MICVVCGRRLKSPESREIGYGPVCYKKMFGKARSERRRKDMQSKGTDIFLDYDIPGQMNFEDFLDA